MRCEVGSCKAKVLFVLSYRPEDHEPDEYEADSRWTCGRHVASTLAAMVRLYETVAVRAAPTWGLATTTQRLLEASESHAEPRFRPGGTPGRDPAPTAVSGHPEADHEYRELARHPWCLPGCVDHGK